MPSFFVLMYGAAGGGFSLRAFVRRVSRGIPRRYIPCRWYEFLERLGKRL